MIHLYEVATVVKFIETRVDTEVGGGGDTGSLLFNGYVVSVLQDEGFWRLHNNVHVLNTTELYI